MKSKIHEDTTYSDLSSPLKNYLHSVICCCCSVAESCQALCDPWIVARQASLSITISWSLLKLMYIESVMPSNHLILCHRLLLLPSIVLINRVFSDESAICIR